MDILIIILTVIFLAWYVSHKFTSHGAADQPSSNLPQSVLNETYKNIRKGLMSGELAKTMDASTILRKDETLVIEIPGVSFCEEKTVRSRGSHQGFSIRVMKGVSYRFGGFQAAPEREVVELDNGTLTITNERLYFSGSTKSIDYPLSKINRIEPMETGVSVSRSGKTKVEYFIGTSNITVTTTVTPKKNQTFEPEEIKYEFSGQECKKVLTTLIRNAN